MSTIAGRLQWYPLCTVNAVCNNVLRIATMSYKSRMLALVVSLSPSCVDVMLCDSGQASLPLQVHAASFHGTDAWHTSDAFRHNCDSTCWCSACSTDEMGLPRFAWTPRTLAAVHCRA